MPDHHRPARPSPALASALALALAACAGGALAQVRPPDGAGVAPHDHASDHVSDALDRRMAEEAQATLRALGVDASPAARAEPGLQSIGQLGWPLGQRPGPGWDWHGISNFVDLDPAFPNRLRDYTCATRTYDTSNGYNHAGIDVFTWPFPWTLMDQGKVEVVAAAGGTLVAKADGNDDRSCSFNAPDTPNYVAIRHADGTVARYLHLKRGSVTALPVGSTVVAGERLGVVGSSGISTGPHLHFELRASSAAGAAVIDPNAGTCNAVPSGWREQRPYRVPAINRVTTHTAPPVFPTCPDTVEVPNFGHAFRPGDPITLLVAYRDLPAGTVNATLRLRRPDGSVAQAWQQATPIPSAYNAAWWYWNASVPLDATPGTWTFEAEYAGASRQQAFQVAAPVSAPGPLPASLNGSWFEPATNGQGFNLELVDGRRFILYFYGYGDDAEPFWLYGEWAADTDAFAWGEALDVRLYAFRGPRWDVFAGDPLQRREWGTARMVFTSCEQASVVLQGEAGTQVLALRKLLTPMGVSCP